MRFVFFLKVTVFNFQDTFTVEKPLDLKNSQRIEIFFPVIPQNINTGRYSERIKIIVIFLKVK